MRKWRPTHKCIYVIPEIHGSLESFKILLNRIIPLRFSINQEDTIVFLGDFIDKGSHSAEVVQILIDLKTEFAEQCIFIRGNHEDLLLKAFESKDNYTHWLSQGGVATLRSYLELQKINSSPTEIPFSRLPDIIPESHLSFFKSLPSHKVIDDYVMFHGGFDISNPIATTDSVFIHDSWSAQHIQSLVKSGKECLKELDKIYVGAHNYKNNLPFIHARYFMLGGSAPRNLIVFELNSMSCAMIRDGKSHIYKHKFKYFE